MQVAMRDRHVPAVEAFVIVAGIRVVRGRRQLDQLLGLGCRVEPEARVLLDADAGGEGEHGADHGAGEDQQGNGDLEQGEALSPIHPTALEC